MRWILDSVIVYGSAFCQVTIMRVAADRQGWCDALAGGLARVRRCLVWVRRWMNEPTAWERRAWERRAVRAAHRELRRAQAQLRVEQLLRR